MIGHIVLGIIIFIVYIAVTLHIWFAISGFDKDMERQKHEYQRLLSDQRQRIIELEERNVEQDNVLNAVKLALIKKGDTKSVPVRFSSEDERLRSLVYQHDQWIKSYDITKQQPVFLGSNEVVAEQNTIQISLSNYSYSNVPQVHVYSLEEEANMLRANRMAVAYYNTVRDQTPVANHTNSFEKFKERLDTHLYIVGFTNAVYKDNHMHQDILFPKIFQTLPDTGKYRNRDVIQVIYDTLLKYIPSNANPELLTLYEMEQRSIIPMKLNSVLDARILLEGMFFPPTPNVYVANEVTRGSQTMLPLRFAEDFQDAARMLAEAMKN
jgi:hypothetical protein